MNPSLWFFFSLKVNIWSWSWGGWSSRGATRQGARPAPSWTGCGPLVLILSPVFLLIPKHVSIDFQVIRRTFVSAQKQYHGNSAENSVSPGYSIRIMQVRVQNNGKSIWKSRYVGDVSTPPSLNICLSSSNSVDKLKVRKKTFTGSFALVCINKLKQHPGFQPTL